MNSLPDSHFLTKHSDFRCFMLVQHLLKFELWAIFIPEAMRVDIYELLKTHGNVTFSYFIDPSGEMKETRIKETSYKQVWREGERKLLYALRKFNLFYRFNPFSNPVKELHGVTDFHEVWRKFIPEPFASDRALSTRVGTLCKFKHLTFNVFNCRDPFEKAEGFAIHDYNRHSMQKQTRKYHGI